MEEYSSVSLSSMKILSFVVALYTMGVGIKRLRYDSIGRGSLFLPNLLESSLKLDICTGRSKFALTAWSRISWEMSSARDATAYQLLWHYLEHKWVVFPLHSQPGRLTRTVVSARQDTKPLGNLSASGRQSAFRGRCDRAQG